MSASSAADPLPVSVTKLTADKIAPFSTELFNRSMSAGVLVTFHRHLQKCTSRRLLRAWLRIFNRNVQFLSYRWCWSHLSGSWHGNWTVTCSRRTFCSSTLLSCQLPCICPYVDSTVARRPATATSIVHSKLDYSNSLHCNLPKSPTHSELSCTCATWWKKTTRWATACKTVRPMLSDRCLSGNVGVLWPNGWMDQDATWFGGRPRPMAHCVRHTHRPNSSMPLKVLFFNQHKVYYRRNSKQASNFIVSTAHYKCG